MRLYGHRLEYNRDVQLSSHAAGECIVGHGGRRCLSACEIGQDEPHDGDDAHRSSVGVARVSTARLQLAAAAGGRCEGDDDVIWFHLPQERVRLLHALDKRGAVDPGEGGCEGERSCDNVAI